jgi:TonB family protein
MASGNTYRRQATHEHLFEREKRETTGLRLGLLAAVAIHLAVFAITWPTLAETKPEFAPPSEPAFRLVQPATFHQSRPIIEVPQLTGRLVPVPGPERQNPEPMIEHVFEIPPAEHTYTLAPVVPTPPPRITTVPDVVDAYVDVNPPSVIHRVEPRYTGPARKVGIEGSVVLSLLIDTDGRVMDLTILRSLPFGLTQNAVQAVRQWLFEPCTFNNKPVQVRYTLSVVYRLDSAP